MAKLSELPNGAWIDVGTINSIRPHDRCRYAGDYNPFVNVGVGTASCFVTLEFETFQAAKDYAAALAKQVNEA